MRHQNNDAVRRELARTHVVDALKRREPRIRVTSVQINREWDPGENVLAIRLRYTIVAKGAAPGAVLAQDLQHAVALRP